MVDSKHTVVTRISTLRTRARDTPQRHHLPVAMAVGILWLGISEITRITGMQGPLSVILAVGLATGGVFVILTRAHEISKMSGIQIPVFLSWATFAFVTLAALVLHAVYNRASIQNVSIYITFVVILLCTATASYTIRDRKLLRIIVWFSLIGTVPFFAVSIPVVLSSPGERFIGTGSIPGVAAIGLACTMGLSRGWFRLIVTILLSLIIVSSLSRVYVVFVLVCLTLPSRTKGTVKRFFIIWIVRAILAGAAGVIAMLLVPSLHDRFVVNDGSSLFGIDIGTSGRDDLWTSLMSQLNSGNVVFGHGPGAAEMYITNHFGTITQPHNDYLRLIFDFGVVGLLPWILGLLLLFIFALQHLTYSIRRGEDAGLAIACVLCAALIAGSALLDNVAIYVFMMAPVAVLFGTLFKRGDARFLP